MSESAGSKNESCASSWRIWLSAERFDHRCRSVVRAARPTVCPRQETGPQAMRVTCGGAWSTAGDAPLRAGEAWEGGGGRSQGFAT